MNVGLMRWIDKCIGGFLIFIVQGAAFAWNRRSKTHAPVKTIVVSKYFGIGSIVLTIPLLKILRQRFPRAKILFISFSTNGEVLELIPCVDKVFLIRPASLFTFAGDTLKCLAWLRANQADTFLDLEFFSRYSALLSLFSGAGQRIGFHTVSLKARGRLLTGRIYLNPYRHIAENFLSFADGCGGFEYRRDRILKVKAPGRRLDFSLKENSAPSEKERLGVLREVGVHEPYIVMNPNTDEKLRHLKNWPDDRWAELVRLIVKERPWPVLFTGSKNEGAFVGHLLDSLKDVPRVYNLAGRLSLTGLVALLHHAAGFVTLDSGPGHLAMALGTPTVMLFGPETPVFYGTKNDRCSTIYQNLVCSPCINILEGKQSDCRENICMKEIEARDVYERLALLMGRKSESSQRP